MGGGHREPKIAEPHGLSKETEGARMNDFISAWRWLGDKDDSDYI